MEEGEQEVEIRWSHRHWHSEPVQLGPRDLSACTQEKKPEDQFRKCCTEKRFHKYNDAFWLPKGDDGSVRISQNFLVDFGESSDPYYDESEESDED